MKGPGKKFEEDFQKSAAKEMFIYRLKDPPQSFNSGCTGCPKLKTRFSPQNICDFIAFGDATLYLLELKSCKGKSVPFKNIVKNEKDTRLLKMVEAEDKWNGIYSFILFNFRDVENYTVAISASKVLNFINKDERSSIPIAAGAMGIEIDSKLSRTRYSYDMRLFK